VLAFPFGDAATPGFESQAVDGGVGDPGAAGRALADSRLFDRLGKIVGE